MRWQNRRKNNSFVDPAPACGVDCTACKVLPPLQRTQEYSPDRKCCEFSPFVSCFALGALLERPLPLRSLWEEAAGELVLTRLGILHSHQHRRQNHKLCRFFDLTQKNCMIWEQRPATCLTFFCVDELRESYQEYEMELLQDEAQWLKNWYFFNQGDEDIWAQWGLSMDAEPLCEIPQALILTNWEEAESSYGDSWSWLQQSLKP